MKHTRHHRSARTDTPRRLYRNPATEDLAWFPENPTPGERYACPVMNPETFAIHPHHVLVFDPASWTLCHRPSNC